jgi:GR25 family glycosyltransferase involved in LPS biosynthesis
MNHLAQQFLQKHDERTATDLVRMARCQNFHHLGSVIAKFMENQFPNSLDIKDEHGIMLYYSHKNDRAYFTFRRLLALRGISQDRANQAIFNQHFCIDAVKNRYVHYEPNRMRKVLNNKKNPFPLVTVTITSCKRWDLFRRTVNSFVNCCKDIHLIDEWICVDDNSSEADRQLMRQFYPFINFYFKTPKEKGHPQSMNIIRKLVKTPYTFHMEDDWQFFDRRNYISDCLEVLGQDPNIGQCLINKNYAEIATDDIKGGDFKTTSSGLRYYVHEFVRTEDEKKEFHKKHGVGNTCNYWPHYSLRPSLLRTQIYHELGPYNETVSHFEMNYSTRYIQKGYVSAFLEGIYCMHIGRLTSERDNKNKPNAYELNDEAQFNGKEEKLKLQKNKEYDTFPFRVKTFVINLDRRPDRWEDFVKHSEPKFLQYTRFSAVDGSKLVPTSQLQQIFDHNDYNMRQGMVGCAMSHLQLCVQLLRDDEADVYCLLEDDLEYVPDFEKKLLHCAHELNKTDWDMFYLGHHLWERYIDQEVHSKTIWPKVEQFDRAESLMRSMGGTGGYMINKKGAARLLEYINLTGMTNGIDTVQQKAADTINVFYAYPHLIYSECYRGDNKPDTDIQFNYTSLTLPLEQRLEEELRYYENINKIDDLETAKNMISCKSIEPFYYRSESRKDIVDLAKDCQHPYYTLDDRVIFVSPKDNGRYFHRFKKNGEWSVVDAIQYQE